MLHVPLSPVAERHRTMVSDVARVQESYLIRNDSTRHRDSWTSFRRRQPTQAMNTRSQFPPLKALICVGDRLHRYASKGQPKQTYSSTSFALCRGNANLCREFIDRIVGECRLRQVGMSPV